MIAINRNELFRAARQIVPTRMKQWHTASDGGPAINPDDFTNHACMILSGPIEAPEFDVSCALCGQIIKDRTAILQEQQRQWIHESWRVKFEGHWCGRDKCVYVTGDSKEDEQVVLNSMICLDGVFVDDMPDYDVSWS